MRETIEQHEKSLDDPSVCELLPVRDYLDGVMVRINGAFVAGYELRGVNAYFASDEERDGNKVMMEALLKSLPEQSMRIQIRYEVVEDLGDLLSAYTEQNRLQDGADAGAVHALDATRLENWETKAEDGHYLRPLLHIYFIWDPRVHHRVMGKPDRRPLNLSLSVLSAKTAIQRSREEHARLVAEFESLLTGI